MIGTTLQERYRVEAELGRGGMGAVYRARDMRLDRDVAVKVLLGDGLDADGRARLQREARAAATLNHPGIVAVYDAGETGDAPFVVMELVAGQSLRDQPTLPLGDALDVGAQICGALAHAHAHGIVHRDLKPENVLVTREGGRLIVKLADLGLALSARGSRLTQAGSFLGTASYMAPEQALGEEVDGRADLYALGVLLYELTAGRLPFLGDDALAVVSQHLYAPVVPPSTYRAGLPPELDAVIVKLMAKQPADRFATAEEAGAALSRVDATASAQASAPAAPVSGAVRMLDQLARGHLVGRTNELSQLRELWTRAERGQGHVVLLSGEPGVGKTRLSREIAVYARLQGAAVLQGGCYEFEATTPYLPFVEALRTWVRGREPEALRVGLGSGAAELAKLAPEIETRLGPLPKSAELSPTEERMRLFDHVARFLQGLAASRGLLLVLDDLHWADHGTLAMLHYLLRQARESRMLVLGAYREAELDRAHPLQKALVEWNRERLATRLALGRLTLAGTSSMLAAMFGQDEVSPDFAEALFRETEGNPFFIEEVVKSLIEQGQIYREGDSWERHAVADLTIPQSIKAAVSRRLDRLSEECTQVLQTAAGLGKTFVFRELAAVATVAEDPLLDALDEATASQLIRSEGRDQFVFTHDKIREVLHEELNPIRQRRLHQRIAESLEKLYAGDSDAHIQDLAYHFAESGDLRKGLDYSRKAAEEAERLYVLEEAARFYERARECAEALEDTAALGEVEEKLGDVFGEIGEANRAAEHYQRALALTRDPVRTATIESKIGEAYARLADARGVPFLEKAMQSLDPERNPADVARALGTLGRYHHHHGFHHKALELLTRARDLAEKSGDPGLISLMYTYTAGAYQHLTMFDESDTWARRSIEFGEKHDYKSAIAGGYEFLAENATGRGAWDDAFRYAALDREWGEKIQSQERMVWSRFATTWALRGKADLKRARAEGEGGSADARRIGESRVARFIELQLVEILSDLGEEEAAWDLAARVYEDVSSSGMVLHQTMGHRLYGYLHGRRGEWRQARERCEAAMEATRGTDNRNGPMLASSLLAEACVRSGDLEAAEVTIADALERVRKAGARHLEGHVLGTRGLWHAARGEFGRAAADFGESIAILEATNTRLLLARVLLERGRFLASRGEAGAARSDFERARALAHECGAAPDETAAAKALGELATA